jgi:hypothetical protein
LPPIVCVWSPPTSSTLNVATLTDWLPPTLTACDAPTVVSALFVTLIAWFAPMSTVSLFAIVSVVLFATSTVMSFEALKNTSSLPFESSIRNSLELPPPGVVAVCTDPRALPAGSAYGGGATAL